MSRGLAAAAAALALALGAALPPASGQEPQDGFRWRRVELHGRLLARVVSTREAGGSASDLDAENARLELRWRPARWLRAVVEYDQAESAHLKDAFVAVRPARGFELRAGQFKPPIGPVEMESRWALPASERGLLSEVLIDSFGIAGRRPGVQGSWDPKGGGLSAAAGLFRASCARGDRIGDESFDNPAPDWSALKSTARLAWQRKRLAVGAGFDLRSAEPVPGEGYRRFWTASADLTLSARRGGGPRAWAEAYAGSSWQDANAFDGKDTRFLAGRLLGGWRLGSSGKRRLFVEPFGALSLVDPDASVRDDVLWEAAGGLHAGGFGHGRLVLEVQHRSVERNAPASLGVWPGAAAPRARTRLVAQLGGAF